MSHAHASETRAMCGAAIDDDDDSSMPELFGEGYITCSACIEALRSGYERARAATGDSAHG